mmetsp:Transcript_5961/g.18332  ORF Transcript_5961/g.18332 Transcript_5961/m.18332 type:complete len:114 (-) Transcript_5961:3152-3493(-)
MKNNFFAWSSSDGTRPPPPPALTALAMKNDTSSRNLRSYRLRLLWMAQRSQVQGGMASASTRFVEHGILPLAEWLRRLGLFGISMRGDGGLGSGENTIPSTLYPLGQHHDVAE